MKIVCKKNSDLTDNELEVLYKVFSNNFDEYFVKDKTHSQIKSVEYEQEWISKVKNDDKTVCAEYFEGEEFVGYILMNLNDNENFIYDFQIIKKYQGDHKTFKEMVKLILPYANSNNKFRGKILAHNKHAKEAFKSVGALPKDGYFEVPFNKVVEFLEKKKDNA